MARRLLTVPAYVLAWVVFSVLSPVWIAVVIVIGIFRRRRFIVLRLMVFLWVYFAAQMLGLTGAGLIYATTRLGPVRDARLSKLQLGWASLLLFWVRRLLQLSLSVQGQEHVGTGPLLIFVRHASIIDTLLPAVLIAKPSGLRLRYVLKRELLIDPCLDVVGHALPNYFVDRGGETERELEQLRRLCDDLDHDAVLLYPEGTRFTTEKRKLVLSSLAKRRPDLQAQAESLTHVLPPKLGGALTLMNAAPDADCLFVAHRGLEGFAEIRHLLDGRVVGSQIEVRMWRTHVDALPAQERRAEWLFAQWLQVNEFVRTGSTGSGPVP